MEYTSKFTNAFNHLMKWEGGAKVTGKAFDGHTTKYGIIEETYQHYHRGKSVVNCTEDEAKYIYYKGYWEQNALDQVCNDSLAEFIFQGVVNMGNNGFIRNCVQYPLGLIADGKVGPKTIQSLNTNSKEKYNKIFEATKNRYEQIASNGKQKFLKGWLNRINDFKYK